MLLTCPNCQSGLQVPDGTTAHVRCPTCRTIFSAQGGAQPPAPVVPPPRTPTRPPAELNENRPRPFPPRQFEERVLDDEDEGPRSRLPPSRDGDDEDRPPPKRPIVDRFDEDRPRRRTRPSEDDEDEDRPQRSRRRRGDEEDTEPDQPPPLSRQRKLELADGLTRAERRIRAQAYSRGMWGARLIMISLIFSIIAMLLIPLYHIFTAITKEPFTAILVIAGLFGIVHWVVGGVGAVLCLMGLIPQGYYRFAIPAVIVVAIHLLMLLGVVSMPNVTHLGKIMSTSVIRIAAIPTQYDVLTFYLADICYPNEMMLWRGGTGFAFATGVMEMSRLVLILLTLSALAKAAGDDELRLSCTRIAGRVTIIPALLAIVMLLYKMVMIETGAQAAGLVPLFSLMLYMGIYALPAWIEMTAMSAARDTADACEFPFQSKQIDFGG